jgi:hypothetical protein
VPPLEHISLGSWAVATSWTPEKAPEPLDAKRSVAEPPSAVDTTSHGGAVPLAGAASKDVDEEPPSYIEYTSAPASVDSAKVSRSTWYPPGEEIVTLHIAFVRV